VRDARERRAALHALVERLGRDRRQLERQLQSLTEHERLTPLQREQFRVHLARFRGRRQQ
jgi:Spy/CpxP family protein refolding chaperone